MLPLVQTPHVFLRPSFKEKLELSIVFRQTYMSQVRTENPRKNKGDDSCDCRNEEDPGYA